MDVHPGESFGLAFSIEADEFSAVLVETLSEFVAMPSFAESPVFAASNCALAAPVIANKNANKTAAFISFCYAAECTS